MWVEMNTADSLLQILLLQVSYKEKWLHVQTVRQTGIADWAKRFIQRLSLPRTGFPLHNY